MIYTHIVELLYELRSRVVCYQKIKPNPRVLGICCFLCAVPIVMLPL